MLGNNYLLGDSGYKCHENLLTPYPEDDTDMKELYVFLGLPYESRLS